MKKTILAFCLIPIASVFLGSGAIASVVKTNIQQTLVNKLKTSKLQTPISEVKNLNELERPITNAELLLVQQSNTATLVQVTGVRINQTNKGIEVILETPQSSALKPEIKREGNKLTADIPNAQLRLPSGNTFRQSKPVAGITEVTVTNAGEKNIQLTVTGSAGVPIVELFDSPNEGLVFGLSATTATGQLPTHQTTVKPANRSNQEPIELVVTGTPEGSYRVPRASIGTRTDTPTQDIPQTVNVIPQQVIKDQHIIYIGDALKNVGISQGRQPANVQDRFVIRGFDASFGNILTDGLRNYFSGSGDALNTSNIERIEVLRGPASVLYGQAGLSGIINIVTKQPLKEPYYDASFSVGSFNSFQPSFDIGGPVTSDKKLLYRLNGSYLSSDSFVDFYHQQRYQIAGALSWDIDKNTKLTLNSSYEDFNRSFNWQGLPAVGTVLPNPNGKLPPSRFLGEPGIEDPRDTTTTRLRYKLEHRFSENWSVENSFQAIISNTSGNPVVAPTALERNNRILDRRTFSYLGPTPENTYDVNTQVTGRFRTGKLEHQLIIGSEYTWDNLYQSYNFLSTPSIDIFNPVYGQTGGGRVLSRYGGGIRNDDLGVYAQDIITLAENIKLVLGARYDWAGSTNFNKIPTSTSTTFSSEAFSPRVGLVYQPIKPISLYASYSRSFVPQTGLSANNNPFQPLRGTEYEVGVKADLLGDKLSANLALYDLTLTNNLTTDPNNINFSIAVGEERSRGVELFVTGEILPGWNVIASYAYTDPRVTKDLCKNNLNN